MSVEGYEATMKAHYAMVRDRLRVPPQPRPKRLFGLTPKPEPTPRPIVFLPPEPVAVETFEEIEQEEGQPARTTVRGVIAETLLKHRVTREELFSRSRSRRIVLCRQECCWRLRETILIQGRQISLPEIGRHLGGLDHTTVLHSIRKFEAMRAT